MEVWLNVAEKPSVAKEMAAVLSERRHNVVRTLSQFNPVFEFPFQLDNGQRVEMIVTSVCGHLMEVDFPSEARRWSAIPFSHLFECPIERKVKPNLENVRKNLVALGKKATKVVLWLDCDREGENICFEVLDVVRTAKPNIGVGRAHFSALTKRDLLRAVNTTTAPNRFLSDAVDARQELDLRIGAAFTRFQTMRLREHFPSIANAVISMGPCQFPTLGFIVRRYWERLSFQKEALFTASMSYDNSSFRWSRGPVYDMLAAALVFEEMMIAAGPTQEAEVIRVDNRQQRRRPPVALSTVALQKAASTHLRFSSERTMKLAEELYQQGYISYPRTETDGFTLTDPELQALANNVAPDPTYGTYVNRLTNADLYRRPIPGGHDDKAHPPIHPTKLLDSSSSPPEKRQLYDLIVRSFLACMSKDAIGAQTTVVAGYGGEEFSTSGHTVLEKNWFDIYPFERWSSTTIPNFTPQQRFVPSSVLLEEGHTEPPPLLSETLLISMMDSQGIGTDATIAQHIKTVQERKYVEVRGGKFIPTPLGIALVAAYEAIGAPELGKPALRAQMELAMDHIAKGQVSKQTVVAAGIAQYKALLFKAMAEEPQIVGCLREYIHS